MYSPMVLFEILIESSTLSKPKVVFFTENPSVNCKLFDTVLLIRSQRGLISLFNAMRSTFSLTHLQALFDCFSLFFNLQMKLEERMIQ